MSRKPLHRELPDLATLHPDFQGFPPRETALRCLVLALRQVIDRVRKDQRSVFYSQKTVADFFDVPQRTVHLAYRQLVREGFLSSRRGSGTLLLGRRLQPATPPRGVVGLPIWTRGFVQLPYWREFLTALEEELRRNDFVADPVHYQTAATEPDLAERLLAHHLDYVIWLYPPIPMRQVFDRLGDDGVRGVAVVHQTGHFPQVVQYLTAWGRHYEKALFAWKDVGIRDVVVVGYPALPASHGEVVKQVLARVAMPYRLWHESNLDDLRVDAHTGVMFPDDLTQVTLCRRSPQAMARLLHRARVLVANSVLLEELPSNVRVDIMRIDWAALAQRIARDLAAWPPLLHREAVVVPAQWLPRAPVRAHLAEY